MNPLYLLILLPVAFLPFGILWAMEAIGSRAQRKADEAMLRQYHASKAKLFEVQP